MQRDTRKMLKFLRESDLLNDGSCMFEDFYDAYCASSGWHTQRAMACIRQLEKDGYISYCEDAYGNHVGFELEHKAYHYVYYTWASFRDFLVKSVIVPIIVAWVTAVITHFIVL